MDTLAKNKDPDEMLHDVAIHQGLHGLRKDKNDVENFIWKF